MNELVIITKAKPTVVNADPTLRGLNTAYDFTLQANDARALLRLNAGGGHFEQL
jgi:hypothetical protein